MANHHRHEDKSSSSSGSSWNNAICVLLLFVSNAVTFWTHRSPWPPGSTTTSTTASASVVRQSSSAAALSSAKDKDVDAPACCNLAYQHSFGLFDDIADPVWREFRQTPSRNPLRYHNPKSPNDKAMTNPTLWVFENIDPWFHCPRKHRLGGLGDGPKYTCDPDRLVRLMEHRERTAQKRPQQPLSPAVADISNDYHKPCLVYSFVNGNRDNYRWEESLAEWLPNKCEIHIFDSHRSQGNPMWEHNATYRDSIQFHPWALKSRNPVATAETVRLSFGDIRKRLQHEGRTIDFFKMDCGGCEWDTWSEWIDTDIRQLLLKTHGLSSDPYTFFEALRSRGLELFSKETDCSNGGRGDSTDWSWIQLAPDFRRNVTAMSSAPQP